MGEKSFQESDLRIWMKNMFRNLVLALGPRHKDFRILDLPKPLRQRFQNLGPTGILATNISEFWTYWNPCVKDFQISRRRRQRRWANSQIPT